MSSLESQDGNQANKKVFLYMSSAFHTAYKNMVDNAPSGFEYVTSQYMSHGIVQPPGKPLKIPPVFLSYISDYYNHFRILTNSPKVRKFVSNDYDLIHSGQSILDTTLPYVVDMEHASVFSGYNQYAFKRPEFLKKLEHLLLDKKLKRVLAWSNCAAKSLTNFIANPEIAAKVETIYPTMAQPKLAPRTSKTFNFLFIGGNFYEKGGYESILAFEKFMDKYDCTFTAIGNIPKDLELKYTGHQKIKLLQRVPYERVVEFFSNSDIFVFPSHYDTYGFVIPEAFSCGLPIISVNSFSTPELIDHEKTGLLIDSYFTCFADDCGYAYPTLAELHRKRVETCKSPPEWYIKLLANAMERMITDNNLRKTCAKNALKEAQVGKFSPKFWKDRIKRIYSESMEYK